MGSLKAAGSYGWGSMWRKTSEGKTHTSLKWRSMQHEPRRQVQRNELQRRRIAVLRIFHHGTSSLLIFLFLVFGRLPPRPPSPPSSRWLYLPVCCAVSSSLLILTIRKETVSLRQTLMCVWPLMSYEPRGPASERGYRNAASACLHCLVGVA